MMSILFSRPRTITEAILIWLVIWFPVILFLWIIDYLDNTYTFWTLLLLLGNILIIADFSYQFILADPPTIGLVTFWERKQKGYIKEGVVFIFPYFPIIEKIIYVNATIHILNITIDKVRCRAYSIDTDSIDTDPDTPQIGGSATVKVKMSYKRDPKRLIEFLGSGGLSVSESIRAGEHSASDGEHSASDGVAEALIGIVEEIIKRAGIDLTWTELTFSTAKLSVDIITRITGQKPKEAYRIDDGGYLEEILAETPQAFLDRVACTKDESAEQAADVHGLGIIMVRANIVEMEGEKALRDAAERFAIEEQERIQEKYDIDTEILLAQQYIDASKKLGGVEMSFQHALEYVRLRRNDGAREIFVRTNGSGNNNVTAAAVVHDGLFNRPSANDD